MNTPSSLRAVAASSLAATLSITLLACGSSAEVPEPARVALSELGSPPPEINQALDQVWRTCMADDGFTVPRGVGTSNSSQSALVDVDGLIPSAEQARALGYRSTVRAEESPADAYLATLVGGEAERFEAADMGEDPDDVESLTLDNGVEVSIPAQGCSAEARTAVYGDLTTALQLQEFRNEVSGAALDSFDKILGSLDGVREPYEECMNSAGYQVTGLNAGEVAQEKFGTYRGPLDSPSVPEQNMAFSDFTCQQEAGMAENINDAFVENTADWIVSNESHILAVHDMMTESENRAKDILRAS